MSYNVPLSPLTVTTQETLNIYPDRSLCIATTATPLSAHSRGRAVHISRRFSCIYSRALAHRDKEKQRHRRRRRRLRDRKDFSARGLCILWACEGGKKRPKNIGWRSIERARARHDSTLFFFLSPLRDRCIFKSALLTDSSETLPTTTTAVTTTTTTMTTARLQRRAMPKGVHRGREAAAAAALHLASITPFCIRSRKCKGFFRKYRCPPPRVVCRLYKARFEWSGKINSRCTGMRATSRSLFHQRVFLTWPGALSAGLYVYVLSLQDRSPTHTHMCALSYFSPLAKNRISSFYFRPFLSFHSGFFFFRGYSLLAAGCPAHGDVFRVFLSQKLTILMMKREGESSWVSQGLRFLTRCSERDVSMNTDRSFKGLASLRIGVERL